MPRLIKRSRKKVGLSPGTLIHVGDQKIEKVIVLKMLTYDIESFRDVLSGLQDLYLSTLSNRMNEVMKVLTIMATIFIPLTFIAGIYGMNFEYMPELKWPWAYPPLWIVLIAIFVFMVFWFKRKNGYNATGICNLAERPSSLKFLCALPASLGIGGLTVVSTSQDTLYYWSLDIMVSRMKGGKK